MKETQTPRSKDIYNRRPKDSPSLKSISDQSKRQQKISKKSLNAEFAFVSEESLTEMVTESPNLSAITEVSSENNHIKESLHSSVNAENQLIVPFEESSNVSDFSPSSKITTITDESIDLSLSPDSSKSIQSKTSMEIDVVVNLLKEARNQVFSSNDVSATSKKHLDALVEAYVKDLCALPDEGDEFNHLLSKKIRVVVICFVIWMYFVTVIMLRFTGTQTFSSFNLPPT